jgi:biopolymer transport protein TolR
MGMGSMGGRGRRGLAAEINVTPLVDVMLVLLIIFMVTAPMMTQGIDINLPKVTAEALPQKDDPLEVTVSADGKIAVGNDKVVISLSMLFSELEKYPSEKKEEPILLRADTNVPYGKVVEVMSQIKRAGFTKLGMMTSPDEDNAGGADK